MSLDTHFFKFSSIASFADAVAAAPSMEALLYLFQEQIESLGFSRFTYWVIWPQSGPRKPLYISTYRKDFTQHYVDRNLKQRDPIWNKALRTVLPFSWSNITGDRNLHSEYRIVFNEGRDFELKSGATLPFHGPGLAKAAISVAADLEQNAFDALFKQHQHYLHILGSYLHEKMIALDVPSTNATIPELSPREREILVWVAAGKTNWEIGEILLLSENTIKKHLQNICEKLGVVNKTQATAYAIMNGIIFL